MGSFKVEMNRVIKYLLLAMAMLVYLHPANAQNDTDTLDLVRKLKTAPNDSIRMNVLNELIVKTRQIKDVGLAYANKLVAYGPASNRSAYGYGYMHLSVIYKARGKHKLAEEAAKKCIEVAEKYDLKMLKAKAYGTLGNVYSQVGDVENSSINLEKSVSIFMEIKDTAGIIRSSMNLGGFYYGEDLYEKALVYFKMGLDYAMKTNDLYMLAQNYNNIGSVCLNTGKLDSAFHCYQRGYHYALQDHSSDLANTILGNLGDVVKKMGNNAKALEYYKQQYAEAKKEDMYTGIANALTGFIEIYRDTDQYDMAAKYLDEFKKHIAEDGSVQDLIDAYAFSSDIYAGQGNFKDALRATRRLMFFKDSINDADVKAKVFELHEQYQGERKDNEILKKTADLEKEQSLSKQRSTQRNILLIVVAFAMVMIGLVLRGYFQKKKYNEEITVQKNVAEKQKELVEEKNKEILDSINYAKRIQDAILPSHDINSDIVKESFILYHPKDIVAGDFYWYGVKNNKRIITAADCTGHGVPGALMSMLGMTFLNEIVNHMGKTRPSDILSELRDLVKETLKQRGSEGESKDGMDMALISLDQDTLKLEFCGANNPLWIFRNENGKTEFIEIDPDKRPVGYFRGMGIPFTNKEFQLKKGDRIYLFTDGYADQFGGPRGKKFKYKQLKELLANILEKPMSEQHTILKETFENWKGMLDQVDDVCIVGIRV
jgi:serine phosphatase RsbU (regulator of sigma subunit)/Tfp pilus assembly protein PilF